MSSVIEKLASSGYLTSQQTEKVGSAVSQFVSALKNDPALLKEAKWQFGEQFGRSLKTAVPLVAAGALVSTGLEAGMGLTREAIGKVRDTAMKSRRYKEMIKANPALSDYPAPKVQMAFDTLHRFNPTYASDPLVAGTFVRNAVEQERIDIQQINSMLKARSDLARARESESPFKPQEMTKQPIYVPKGGFGGGGEG